MNVGALCISVVILISLNTFEHAEASELPEPKSSDLDARVGFILDHPLPESEYSESKRCVFTNRYDSVEVLDRRHLLFKGRRGAIWLNQLRFDCLGLRRDAVLVFEAHDQSLCNQDSFRSVSRGAMIQASDLMTSTDAFGAHCVLGDFEPISGAQAELLRVALANRASASNSRRTPPVKAPSAGKAE